MEEHDEDTLARIGGGVVDKAKPLDFFTGVERSFDATTARDISFARERALYRAYADMDEIINAGLPYKQRLTNPYASERFGLGSRIRARNDLMSPAVTVDEQEAAWWQRIAEMRARDPQLLRGAPATREALHALIKARRQKAVYDAEGAGLGGALVGGLAAGALDPVNIATLPLGGGGKTLAGVVVREGLTNAAVEAAMTPEIKRQYDSLDQPMTADDIARNIALAGALGGAVGGVAHGVGTLLDRRGKGAPAGTDVPAAPPPAPPAPLDVPALMAEDHEAVLADLARSNGGVPPANGPQRLEDTLAALHSEQPLAALAEVRRDYGGHEADLAAIMAPHVAQAELPGVVQFAPHDLHLDDGRFRSRGEAEADGLADAQDWQPQRGGLLQVWEDEAGKAWVIDGHRRVALAQRLNGDAAPATLPAYVWRAADGVSADDARALGALMDMGTATSSEKRALLRDMFEAADVPPPSALVEQVAGLTRLADDTWRMAVLQDAPTALAALVGERVSPPDQVAMLRMLLNAPRGPIEEAQARVTQVLAADDLLRTLREVQNDDVRLNAFIDRLDDDARAVPAAGDGQPSAGERGTGAADAAASPGVGPAAGAAPARGRRRPVRVAPEATAPADFEDFMDPAGAGAAQQVDSLMHDLRAQAAASVQEYRHPVTGITLDEARVYAQELFQRYPGKEGEAPGTHNLPGSTPAPPPYGTRENLRQVVSEQFLAMPAAPVREVHLVLGPPAAGKSTLAQALAQARNLRIIDSDTAKMQLPEFENGLGGGIVHIESDLLARAALKASIKQGDALLLPIVGKTLPGVMERIHDLRAADYDVFVHLVDLPIEKAVERAKKRFASDGRFVDPDYVASVGDAPVKTFAKIISDATLELKGWSHVSNDVTPGQAPRLIDEGGDAALLRRSSGLGSGMGALEAGGSGQSPAHGEGSFEKNVPLEGDARPAAPTHYALGLSVRDGEMVADLRTLEDIQGEIAALDAALKAMKDCL